MFVDDVRELQAALVGGLVELEVDRPHMIRSLSVQSFAALGTNPTPFAWSLRRPFEALVTPQPLDPLTVHRASLPGAPPASPSCNPTVDACARVSRRRPRSFASSSGRGRGRMRCVERC